MAFIAFSQRQDERNFRQHMFNLSERANRMFKKFEACLTSGTFSKSLKKSELFALAPISFLSIEIERLA